MTHKALSMLVEVIKRFRDYDQEMQMQTAQVFLEVAKQPGITMRELEEREWVSPKHLAAATWQHSRRFTD